MASAYPTREELIAMVRDQNDPHIPAWARSMADDIEAATIERSKSILTTRLAGVLGYYIEDDDY